MSDYIADQIAAEQAEADEAAVDALADSQKGE